MINSDYKDADGFRLQFEESVADDERKYYMKTFPRVDDVSKDRVHCTTCDCHVGTAPISEKIIRTHQILSVTQCNKCFAFYNSGEFGKGEDGSEYYCRWCGQGGEVFCCSTCPFVFCNKCIKDNLTDKYVKEIEENDDWSCFVCNKEILKRLRAQHWALRNFMNKQLEKIQKVNINSEEELNNLLNDDLTVCCPKKKRKLPLPKPAPVPVKRPMPNGTQISMAQPLAKRPALIAPNKQIKIPVHPNFHQPKPGPRVMAPKRNQNEVVCTPDIMGLFNEQAGNSATTAPPPLAMRQIQRPLGPRQTVANPIYHTVNGYQIDLNQASRQEIFRLPNGKLIQVRKQTNPTAPPRLAVPATPATPLQSTLTGVMPRGTQFSIRPTSVVPNMTTQSRMMRPQTQSTPRIRAPSTQQRFSFSDGRVVSGGGQGTAASNTTTNSASTIFTQQNGSISVARAPQPDTTFGKAKTGFEDRIIQGLEICQHTINKMITLTNSTSFKTSRTFADLKDLYIHLQYLFTYTSGKFKTLQEGLVTGMEELAKHDASLKEKNAAEDDDDLEVVQQKVDVIEVMSDDDDEPSKTVEKTPKKAEPPAKIPGPKSKTTNLELTTDETMEDEGDLPTAFLETILETPPSTVAQTILDPAELIAGLNVEIDDEKVKKRTVVKVERLEDSKSSVIKQYLIAIQQRRDAQVDDEESEAESVERETSPDMLLMPEVVLEESQKEGSDNELSKVDEAMEAQVENDEKISDENEKVDDDVATTIEAEKMEALEATDATVSDVVEIPSDDEDQTNNSVTQDDSKIDSMLPVDLMEVDDSVKETTEATDESIVEVSEALENDVQSETNGVASPKNDDKVPADDDAPNETTEKEVQHENGINHAENGISDDKIEASEPEHVKKIVENESAIDDEKDLLDTLINSLDEPLAPMDVEIPEALN